MESYREREVEVEWNEMKFHPKWPLSRYMYFSRYKEQLIKIRIISRRKRNITINQHMRSFGVYIVMMMTTFKWSLSSLSWNNSINKKYDIIIIVTPFFGWWCLLVRKKQYKEEDVGSVVGLLGLMPAFHLLHIYTIVQELLSDHEIWIVLKYYTADKT